MWGMHDGFGMGWGWGLFGAVWMILFWGSIIALVMWVVSRLTHHPTGGDTFPLDIAKVRYARGEIAREEFERLKQDLA